MKRGINKLLWPCAAIGMHNELNQCCLGCEGIFCGERENAHLFVVQFLLKNAPGRPENKVYAVAGDGFFNQKMITRFGFTNAKFIADCFHLFDSGKKLIVFQSS